MASPPPLGIRAPAPERLGRDLSSGAMASTHPSAKVAAAVSPSRDVISEILSWLPAKSLNRCRRVSKEWRALVSDPAFLASRRSRTEPLLVTMSDAMFGGTLQLLDTDGTVVKVVEDPGRGSSGHWMLLRATHGDLACISSGYDLSGTLVVDLATGKTLFACFKRVKEMSYWCFGFGRAVHSGSLKVFRLGIPHLGVHTTCEVLTVGDGAKWRRTESPPTMPSRGCSNTSGVAVNGALHFLSRDKCDVLSFDLDQEKWKLIHGPQGGLEAISIAELNGALCMAQSIHRVINIWLLSDSDKNIWIKAYTMPVPEYGFEMPLRLLRLGRELLFCRYDYKGKLVLEVYNPRSRQCAHVQTSPIGGKIGFCSSNLDPRFCGQS